MELTVKEIAKIKGCTARAVQKAAASGSLSAKIAPDGRSLLIDINSLPFKDQRKFYEKSGMIPPKESIFKGNQRPKKHYGEFSADERREIDMWKEIISGWVAFRSQYPGNMRYVDQQYINQAKDEHGLESLSYSSLMRHKAALDSNNYEDLIDMRGKCRKGKTSTPKDIQDIFNEQYGNTRKPTYMEAYTRTAEILQVTNQDLLDKLPSLSTLKRGWFQLPEPVRIMAREGQKGYRNKCSSYIVRDPSDLRSGSCWIADNHKLDIFSTPDGKTKHRLSLTLFIDARSWMPCGWNVTDNPCSESTVVAMRHGIIRTGCIPDTCYFDNGSEFLTHDIAGRGHRTRKNSHQGFVPPPIFMRLGIEMINAIPGNPRAKTIERYFKEVKERLSSLFWTYCGGNILERPDDLDKKLKDISQLPTDAEVREAVNILMAGMMTEIPYGGQVGKDRGKPLRQVWNDNLPQSARMAAESDLDLMLMRTDKPRKIGRNGAELVLYGIKMQYGMEELWRYQGKQAYIRYDPSDLRTVRVYLADGDIYLATVGMNYETTLKFLDTQENIKAAMAKTGRVSKLAKEELRRMQNAVDSKYRIDILDLRIRNAYKNMGSLAIDRAPVVEMVTSREEAPVEFPAATESLVKTLNRVAEAELKGE